MEEQTNPSNDTAEQTIPKQETTLEEEETSPPQDTSADPLTQIADALSKLLVARSPREIDVSPYDGTFEAQSFFDNFDAQADRTELTYTDRLRKLPCYLQGISQMTRIITTQYYWKGISKSIEKFVRSCHTCQIIKRPKDTIAGFSKYGHSKTYLHVIVDHLTRYAWTFPSKSTSTLTYIQTLKTVLQQGSPKRLLSDRAPAFTSEKFRKFLIMHGGPGSGKGTQCDKIVEKYGFTHLSTGDILRATVASGSPKGKELEEIMKQGSLVSQETVVELLKDSMQAACQSSNGFLIDGYPREVGQATIFEDRICKCDLVLFFDVPDDVMVQRLLRRGETSGRVDDNVETILKRLDTFHRCTDPILAYFGDKVKKRRLPCHPRGVLHHQPDLQSWIFPVGLEDHTITISSAAKHAIYIFFVDHKMHGVAGDPLTILHQTL
ncbi:AK1 [Cordylochernes scorpioides]|uniref:AK1 n=1 Tax=Cordylochernes scorpioides TaxID=51811 RepID=A0ABY6KD46_9ARAC|nr:AK1 [Cordylochernes scorpioides]